MYSTPCKSKACFNCKYKDYDSWDNKSYCNHNPLPEGLCGLLEIDMYGSCEYWELSEVYK